MLTSGQGGENEKLIVKIQKRGEKLQKALDNKLDTADLGLLIAVFGSSDIAADINGDGIVDTADLGIMVGNFGSTCDGL